MTEHLINLGHGFLEQGAYSEAEHAFAEATEEEPENPRAWFYLGNVLRYQGRHDEAEVAYKRSLDLDSMNPDTWNNLGIALEHQGRLEESQQPYEKAIELGPDLDLYRRNLSQVLIYQGKYGDAESIVRQTLGRNREDPLNWLYLGNVLRYQGRHDEAEVAYKRSLDLDSTNPDAWNNLGIALEHQGRLEESQQSYEKATELEPDQDLYWRNLGNCLHYQEKYVGSEEAYRSALDLDSTNPKTWNTLGIALEHQGRLEESQQSYEKATELEPDQDLYWRNLGNCLYYQEKYVGSEEAYRSALAINKSDPRTLYELAIILNILDKPEEAEELALQVHQLRPDKSTGRRSWRLIASIRERLGRHPHQILNAYIKMARDIELERSELSQWEDRLEVFEIPALAFQIASTFAIHPYPEQSLEFAVQAKGRTLQEFLEHDTRNLRRFLGQVEQQQFDQLIATSGKIGMAKQGWDLSSEFGYSPGSPTNKRSQISGPKEQEQDLEEKKRTLDNDYEAFLQQVVSNHPELEPFIRGPTPQKFRFSLPKLQRKFRLGEGVLELLDNLNRGLLLFLVTKEGLANHSLWPNEQSSNDGLTLEEWRNEVNSTLHIGEGKRAEGIKRDLTPETLARWGELLYGPFIDDLKDITRLWISPHSFLTQLPFNAIPFPDGIEREVAIIPSAASLTRPSPKGPRPKPRFTLGVVASDSLRENPRRPQPLDLQTEEVRRLRRTVKSARRRWELAGNKPGEEPSLANIQERVGLTRCLVLSCHGTGPNAEWGTLALGDVSQPELVTGRALVDSLLLGGRLRNMEVDLVITSACLTGQIDLERAEEWLGLPMALQSVWKTKAMLLTLWEVQELPAMIWVEELVKALTQGLSAGEAQKIAQEKVKTVTKGEIESLWLAEAQQQLPEDKWRKVYNQWRDTSRSAGQYPFSEPLHWAPFILVGDPKITVSPGRPSSI